MATYLHDETALSVGEFTGLGLSHVVQGAAEETESWLVGLEKTKRKFCRAGEYHTVQREIREVQVEHSNVNR